MRKLIGSIALIVSSAFAAQCDAADSPDTIPPMKYVHIYTDSSGNSHFREESFDFRATRTGGPLMHALTTGPSATLLRLKPGAFEDWHNAPKPWYLIVVQGTSEVKVSDGEVRRFGPGSLVLIDDISGKGHQTRAVGDIDHIAAVIPLAEPTADTPKH
jgi:quercetin dioxygenase-like cupin family protein